MGFGLCFFSVFWQVSRSSAFAGLEGEVIITFLSYLLAFGVTFYTILLMSHVLLDRVFLTVVFWWAYIKTVIRFPVSHIYWKHFIIYLFYVYWFLPTWNRFQIIRKFLWSNPASIQYALKVISIMAEFSCPKNCLHLFHTIFCFFYVFWLRLYYLSLSSHETLVQISVFLLSKNLKYSRNCFWFCESQVWLVP